MILASKVRNLISQSDKLHRQESEIIKKCSGFVIILLLGIFIAVFSIRAIDLLSSYSTDSKIKQLILLFFNKNILLLLFAIIIFSFFYQKIYYKNEILNLSIPTVKIINALVYIHVVTLFFQPRILPLIFPFTFLLIAVFLDLPRQNTPRTPLSFNLLVVWFIFSTLIGLMSGIAGLNQVRASIPLKEQINLAIPLANGLFVYYVTVRNKWGFKEFDRLLHIILWGGLFISIESLMTLYFRQSLFFKNSFNKYGMFQSTFVESFHTAGRIGMIMFFASIYFWFKRNKFRYLIFPILSLFLIYSTFGRQEIFATLIGISLFVIFLLKYGYFRRINPWARPVVDIVTFLVITVIIITIVNFSLALVYKNRPVGYDSITPLLNRLSKIIRGTDIFTQHFLLGAGTGLSPYYILSAHVKPIISDPLFEILGISQAYLRYRVYLYDFKPEDVTTIHNFWIQNIVELGVVGLLFTMYFLFRGFKMLRFLFTIPKRCIENYQWRPIFAICCMIISISISVLFTSKFNKYWFFAIMFSFLNYIYKSARKASMGIIREQ